MDALTCIYMYCNIERNIMKNKSGSPSFGKQGVTGGATAPLVRVWGGALAKSFLVCGPTHR